MTSRDQFSPMASYSSSNNHNEPRRLSTIAPIEPSPILDRTPTAPSPTTTSLDQYHQKPSRSPDEQRRQSFSSFEPAPILAPIVSAPSTTLIREPSAQPVPEAKMTEPQAVQRQQSVVQSPAHIKDEPSGTPRENTPAQAAATIDRKGSVADEELDPETDTTPSSRTSKTPANASRTGKTSKSNTPALGGSPAPSARIASSDVEEGSGGDDDEHEEYCICRKGDNHTWMIACDGGCDDWFHGKCVDIREEDGALIDKYICPSCEEKDKGITTWLPMCRNDGCRQPARLKKGDASKYCSDTCGQEFMKKNVDKSAGATGSTSNSKAKNRRKDSDEDMGPRGGALRPGEIKALVTSVPDITQFRRLGEGVLTPPATTSPTTSKFPDSAKFTNGTTNGNSSYTFNDSEGIRIAEIAKEKEEFRKKRSLFKDKEKFVAMTREQVGKYAEREGLKPKDVCGYDRRLTWSDDRFDKWRKSKEGVTALEVNSLDPVEIKEEEEKDTMDIDGETKKAENGEGADQHFCKRKRCERHRQWQKGSLADVRFEESMLADEMRKLEREERDIKEQALLRWRKSMGGQGEEGRVEVVGGV
ncbi:hypothetical protein EJ08DRAFT_582717 [Tothia fuscella]|uniref:PHD-type domain-containing protein n=1 Tax=Tothia fuscella TaxID=1048955 RepID=A0A9P4NZG6_9PEZI|nr:hypothetical protein EJ08DRAFT_582717 [Tothia fuscella]